MSVSVLLNERTNERNKKRKETNKNSNLNPQNIEFFVDDQIGVFNILL